MSVRQVRKNARMQLRGSRRSVSGTVRLRCESRRRGRQHGRLVGGTATILALSSLHGPGNRTSSTSFECGKVESNRFRMHADDDIHAGGECLQHPGRNRLQASAHPISDDSDAHPLRDDESKACGRREVFMQQRRDGHAVGSRACATSDGETVVISVGDAMTPRQHRNYAVSFARPLRRREAMIERPARVRMRRRKPCTLARRRLLGWKVRFDMEISVVDESHGVPCGESM